MTNIINEFLAQLGRLDEVNLVSTFLRLILAGSLGGIIGLERGRRRRAAGLRTHMLVCMGAALVMITNQYITTQFPGADPSRLGAQVISGIGFLGVGTIIVDRRQQVRGLTTAAGLWASACMGLAVGIGFYSGALITGFFIWSVITLLNRFEHHILSKSRTMEVYAEFEASEHIDTFLGMAAQSGIIITKMEHVPAKSSSGKDKTGHAAAILIMQLPKKHVHTRVLEELDAAPGLVMIEEIH